MDEELTIVLPGPGRGDATERVWPALLRATASYRICLCPRLRDGCAARSAFLVPAGRLNVVGPSDFDVVAGTEVETEQMLKPRSSTMLNLKDFPSKRIRRTLIYTRKQSSTTCSSSLLVIARFQRRESLADLIDSHRLLTCYRFPISTTGHGVSAHTRSSGGSSERTQVRNVWQGKRTKKEQRTTLIILSIRKRTIHCRNFCLFRVPLPNA